MKFSILFLIETVLVSQTSCFFGPLGLGLGLRRQFLFGRLGLGLGGVAVPVPVPVPVPAVAPVVAPAVVASPFLGKREAQGYSSIGGQVDSSVNVPAATTLPSAVTVDDSVLIETPAVVTPDVVTPDVVTPDVVVQPPVVPSVENGSLEFDFGVENGTESLNETVSERRQLKAKRFVVVAPLLRPLVVAPVVGKRSVLNMTGKETVCSLSSGRSVLTCRKEGLLVECGVIGNLSSLGHFELKGENFRMLPQGSFTWNVSSIEDVQRVDIGSWLRGSEFNDYTTVQGGHRVVVSLSSPDHVSEAGFRFVDNQCWRNYVDLLKQLDPQNVRLTVNILHV